MLCFCISGVFFFFLFFSDTPKICFKTEHPVKLITVALRCVIFIKKKIYPYIYIYTYIYFSNNFTPYSQYTHMLSSLEKNESRPLFQCGICNQIFDPVSFRLTSIWITSPNRLNYFNILTISCIPLPSLCVFIDLSRSFPMHANGISILTC